MTAPDLTVYHDGSCPLCRLEIGHYRSQRGAERIAFVDVSVPGVDPGPDLDRREAMRRFHVRLPSGELKAGGPAFAEIWALLPRWQGAARLASLPGMTGLLDVGYKVTSPLRPVASRLLRRLAEPRPCWRILGGLVRSAPKLYATRRARAPA